MNKYLVLCPLAHEAKALRQYLLEFGHMAQPITRKGQSAWSLPTLSTLLAVGGHGKAEFAARTQFFIQNSKDLNLVVCAGVAGALDLQLKHGDVVVAQNTVEHDFQLKFKQQNLPHFPGSKTYIQRIRDLKIKTAHIGAIASGDEDILSRQRAQEIYEQSGGALAVAWEGAGGARAAQLSQLDYLEIRGISDLCNGQTLGDFKVHFQVAMKAVAKTLLQVLTH